MGWFCRCGTCVQIVPKSFLCALFCSQKGPDKSSNMSIWKATVGSAGMAQWVRVLVSADIKTWMQTSSTCVKIQIRTRMLIISALESRDRWTQRPPCPASLAETAASFKFSELSYLKAITWRTLEEDTWACVGLHRSVHAYIHVHTSNSPPVVLLFIGWPREYWGYDNISNPIICSLQMR